MRWIRQLLQWLEQRQLRKRGLFTFRVGNCLRYADPAVAWRGLLNHPKHDFAAVAQLAAMGQEPEYSQLLDLIAETFSVQRWNEADRSGMTEWELLDLLQEFDGYLTALKKNTSPSRTPWQLSGYGQSSGSTPTPHGIPIPVEDTSVPVASSSSAAESKADAPSPSLSPSLTE